MDVAGPRRVGVLDPSEERRETLGALFDALGEAVLFARFPDRQVLDVNDAFCALFGVSRQAALTGTTEFLYPSREQFLRVGERIATAMRAGRPATIECTFQRADGSRFVGELRISPVREYRGQPVPAVSIIRDLTQRRAMEQENAAQRERLEALLKAQSEMGNAIVVLNARRIEWANDAFCDLVGRSLAELTQAGFWDLVPPEDLADSRRIERDWQAGDATAHFDEMRLRHASGRVVPVEVASKPERVGPDYRVVAVARDVTKRKAQEGSLRQNALAFETLATATARISAELELEKVVQAITDGAVHVTGAAFGAYFYNAVDERGESYQLYTVSGVPRERFSRFPMPRNTAVFAPTFAGEAPVRSDDITKDARYGRNPPHHGMPEGHLPVRSYLAVAVRARDGTVHGGIFLGHPEPGRFTEQHERLVETLAAQAAVAIDNALLYAKARASEERLRTLFEHAPVQVATVDACGTILTLNRSLTG
ncbi:MAG TPA: PAS domain S-box protein, partial [Candidatus Thermoplasmatota archaeon]|nr:PAS domain S-box protein [Candidatus Thermoplasmatota archaeon]